jgi:hypothetical protein
MNYFIVIYATNTRSLLDKNRKHLKKITQESLLKNHTIIITDFKIPNKIRYQFEEKHEEINFNDLKEYSRIFTGGYISSQESIIEFKEDSFSSRSKNPDISNISFDNRSQNPNTSNIIKKEDKSFLNDNYFIMEVIEKSNKQKENQNIVKGVRGLLNLKKQKEETPSIVKDVRGVQYLLRLRNLKNNNKKSNETKETPIIQGFRSFLFNLKNNNQTSLKQKITINDKKPSKINTKITINDKKPSKINTKITIDDKKEKMLNIPQGVLNFLNHQKNNEKSNETNKKDPNK